MSWELHADSAWILPEFQGVADCDKIARAMLARGLETHRSPRGPRQDQLSPLTVLCRHSHHRPHSLRYAPPKPSRNRPRQETRGDGEPRTTGLTRDHANIHSCCGGQITWGFRLRWCLCCSPGRTRARWTSEGSQELNQGYRTFLPSSIPFPSLVSLPSMMSVFTLKS